MNSPTEARAILPQKIEYHEIVKLMPYKSPWLLVDRVLSWNEHEIVVAKAISGAEANISTHMADGPSIMPGVLQIELVNQSLMLLVILLNMSGMRRDTAGGAGVVASVKAKFISSAFIGEVITARVRPLDKLGNKTMFEGLVSCGDRAVAEVTVIGAQVFQARGA